LGIAHNGFVQNRGTHLDFGYWTVDFEQVPRTPPTATRCPASNVQRPNHPRPVARPLWPLSTSSGHCIQCPKSSVQCPNARSTIPDACSIVKERSGAQENRRTHT